MCGGGGGSDPLQAVASATTLGMSDLAQGKSWGAGVVGDYEGGPGGFFDQAISGGAGRRAANAQGQIAMAQLAEQRAQRAAATAAAEPTPEELAQLERSIQLNTQDIARKEKLLASSDPALIEAGTQALALLQGKEASILAPLKNQRAKEEAALREKLRSQLGSGYENTTAGIQALQAFGESSNNVYANAQQQSLAQLLGVAQNTSAGYGIQNNISNAGNIANQFGNISNRRVSAINSTPITAAGSQYAGDLANAQQQAATMNQLVNLGVKGAAAYATGGKSLYGQGTV